MNLTWEDTIKYIRNEPAYNYLVEKAYFDENLALNVERFKNSEEYRAILEYIRSYQPTAASILDIGCGNGITAISLALSGYKVVAVEPDKSDTIGSGAIKKLIKYYKLSNIEVIEAYAENLPLPDSTFDVVFSRQCMHHAHDLEGFIMECARVLNPNGLLFTVRDHVVFNKKDKKLFFESHPLQRFYGGENAFSPQQYKKSIEGAGLCILKELKFYDSVINYYPLTVEEFKNKYTIERTQVIESLKRKFPYIGSLFFFQKIYLHLKKITPKHTYDEIRIPGRMYSYIAVKL